jgi:uncharacterized membrane protein
MRGYRFATSEGTQVEWALKRNCSISPLQLAWFYASLCVISLGIATFFWLQGATLVLPFASVELAAVGMAFLAYARHATDGERISLKGPVLVVELESAGRRERAEFHRDWVRVEPHSDGRSLIELSGRGQQVRIGRFVRPEQRRELAQEIRRALRESA